MDEYLSDKEQVERLRQWWRENGWFLLGGVALGLLGLYGYNQYFAYQDAPVGRRRGVICLGQGGHRRQRYGSGRNGVRAVAQRLPRSRLYASSRVARSERRSRHGARRARPRNCVSRWSRADDPELAMVARLRLARVLAYREQYAEALALLNVPMPGQFAGRIAEIRGDIHVALGETDAARTAYLEAMVTPGAELLDRGFVQMKLADLPGAAPEPVAGRRCRAGRGDAEPTPRRSAEAPADAALPQPPAPHGRGRMTTLRRIALSSALLAVLGGCAGQEGCERAAGRAHRVRGDARRAESVERQGRRRVRAVASRAAARHRRRANLCRRLRRPSRGVRRRDRRQGLVGEDAPAADGRPRIRRRRARVRHGRRRARGSRCCDRRRERWRQPIGSEVLAAPAIGSGVIAVRTRRRAAARLLGRPAARRCGPSSRPCRRSRCAATPRRASPARS